MMITPWKEKSWPAILSLPLEGGILGVEEKKGGDSVYSLWQLWVKRLHLKKLFARLKKAYLWNSLNRMFLAKDYL